MLLYVYLIVISIIITTGIFIYYCIESLKVEKELKEEIEQYKENTKESLTLQAEELKDELPVNLKVEDIERNKIIDFKKKG